MESDELLAVIRRLPASQPLTNEYEALQPLGAASTANWATQKDRFIGLNRPGMSGDSLV